MEMELSLMNKSIAIIPARGGSKRIPRPLVITLESKYQLPYFRTDVDHLLLCMSLLTLMKCIFQSRCHATITL